MNTRRKLIIALGAGALTAPFGTFAQQQDAKLVRIGLLYPSVSGSAVQIQALREGLRDLGYSEGRNISMEFRSAEGDYERLPGLASDLVRLKPDLLVGSGTPSTQALKAATTTIPIVMMGAGDPVGNGLVASLARPGGNVTGVSNLSPPLMIKRLELLKETHPRVRRVGVLLNPANPAQRLGVQAVQTTAAALKIEVQDYEVRDLDEITKAFAAMKKQRIDAVLIGNDSLFIANRKTIAELAAKQRVLSSGSVEFAQAGGLIGYGSMTSGHRYAATYVDKILKGAKPADLPIEQPNKIEVTVNLKTSKALGIKVPQSILVRADRVIE
jgi:putative ABC transport system substrate-binding protein